MFKDNQDFYPTPKELVQKMIDKLPKSLREYKYILEPSCGKGNIIDYTKEIYRETYGGSYYREVDPNKYLTFDGVEQDENLISLCRGKGINIVWNDFLSLDPPRFYDLILMNPPFANGDKHLSKAINIQKRTGGTIVCILNAETIKNPYTNNRQALLNKLNEYNSDIEYIEQAFTDAERKTNVEIALIYLEIPMADTTSMFEKEFKRENINLNFNDINSLTVKMNPLEKLVFEYNIIKKSTISLYQEQIKTDKLLNGLGVDYKIILNGGLSINEFLEKLNLEFWERFIEVSEFKKKLPTKLRDSFQCDMQKQKNIAFTIENLQYFYEQLMKAIPKSYEETVGIVFNTLTSKHSYTGSAYNKTIHYFDGWKSNCCYMIKPNGKTITPFYGQYFYRMPDTLLDLNTIFNNISGVKDNIDTQEIRKRIENHEKNIETEHFIFDSFKKGTIHTKFKNEEHLKIFNLIANVGNNSLPPNFTKKKYQDMTEDEKKMVKEFGFEPVEFNNMVDSNTSYIKLLN